MVDKVDWERSASTAPVHEQYRICKPRGQIPGNRYHFLPVDFKLIAGLIAQDKLGAWEASDRRTFLHIPEGQEGAQGFYDAETNDIYIVSGLSSTDRQCIFVHEAMHAIRDFRNLPDKEAKYIAADGYIMQAF